jgi:hypothetical protein
LARRTDSPDGRRHISTRRKLTFAAVLVVLVGVSCEAAVRVRAWIKYGTSSSSISEGMTVRDPTTGILIPKAGYNQQSSNISISINSLGFRGDEIAQKKPANTVRIACLGASTTFSTEVSNNHATWPAQLQTALEREYPGVAFEVINAAVPGYVITDNLINLRHRVLPLDPDLVIYYEANNDMALDTRALARREGVIAETGNYISPATRWLSDHSLLFDLVHKNSKILFAEDTDSVGKLTHLPSDLPSRFENELGHLDAELRGKGIPLLLSTFVVKYRRDQPRATQMANANLSFYYMPWMTIDGLLDAMDYYNDAILRYAHAHDVPVVDDRTMIPADAEHFVDWAHMTDAGSAVQAERFRRFLVTSGMIRKIVDRRRANSTSVRSLITATTTEHPR